MIDERPIADREQRQNKWGPLAVGEWLGIVVPPAIYLLLSKIRPGLLPFLLFVVLNATIVLHFGRKYPNGTWIDVMKYRFDLLRYRTRHFYPRRFDSDLRDGNPFLTPPSPPSPTGAIILLTTLAVVGAGFVALVTVILGHHR